MIIGLSSFYLLTVSLAAVPLQVPEPAMLMILGSGMMALGFRRKVEQSK